MLLQFLLNLKQFFFFFIVYEHEGHIVITGFAQTAEEFTYMNGAFLIIKTMFTHSSNIPSENSSFNLRFLIQIFKGFKRNLLQILINILSIALQLLIIFFHTSWRLWNTLKSRLISFLSCYCRGLGNGLFVNTLGSLGLFGGGLFWRSLFFLFWWA